MNKIIFLDIDGVLNDWLSMLSSTEDDIDTPSDQHLILLKEIIDATDAKIVLSSTWRLFKHSYKIVEKRLADFDMKLFDKTLELACRADEINDWLSKHPDVERFVILDDEPISHSFPKNLVQTTMQEGLLEEHVKKAIEILNN